MALRVLLADESTSIKKVMQLALQDFGVEVKSVPIGLDVAEVAKSFQPDIAFIDVLLQKRSGYEVCADLRNDPELQQLPIVLMWSGFMDLDEKKLKVGRPNARLEKPFETSTLREVTTKLVPRLKGNPVEQYLRFPHLPNFEEEKQTPAQPPQMQSPPAQPPQQQAQPSPSPAQAKSLQPPQQTPKIPEDFSSFDQFEGMTFSPSSGAENLKDGSDFDSLGAEFENLPPIKEDFDFGDFGDDLAPPSIELPDDESPGDLAPEGIDFGDADEGFTHVPLSALKQGQNPQSEPQQAPQPQGGMRDKINDAMRSGQLEPSYSRTQNLNQHHQNSEVSQRSYQDDFEQPENSRIRPGDENEASGLSRFKIDLPEVDLDDVPMDYDDFDSGPMGEPEQLERREPGQPVSQKPSFDPESMQALIKEEVTRALPQQLAPQLKSLLQTELKAEQLEETIRSIAAEAVEAAVWKLVPDIAERLVREELAKILKQIDDSVGVK